MGYFIATLALFVFLFCLVWFFVRLIKRKPKKQPALGMLVCFILIAVGLASTPSSSDDKGDGADVGEFQKGHDVEDIEKDDAPVLDAALKTEPSIEPAPASPEPAYEFDSLQKVFISITESTSIKDIENAIAENQLSYSVVENNKSGGGKSTEYVLAYTDGSAAQKYADEGDYLEITFDKSPNVCIMYAQYVNCAGYTGFFYNYGIWFDFREEVSGPYSGYYVIDAFAKEDGLTIEYSNGNKTTTNYFPNPSAEDVIKAVIDHSAVD